MLKIISAKVAARKAIKAQLQKEIPLLNDAIEKAMAEGETTIEGYDGEISEPTLRMLKKAGYSVDNWNMLNTKPIISWHFPYCNCCENDSELEKLAKELELKIVEMQ